MTTAVATAGVMETAADAEARVHRHSWATWVAKGAKQERRLRRRTRKLAMTAAALLLGWGFIVLMLG